MATTELTNPQGEKTGMYLHDDGKITLEDGTEVSSFGSTFDSSRMYTTTDGTILYTSGEDLMVWKDLKIEEEEEFNQEEIDKIGVPGKRTIDDLLSAFKAIKRTKMANSAIERLEDEGWAETVFSGVAAHSSIPEPEITEDSKGT